MKVQNDYNRILKKVLYDLRAYMPLILLSVIMAAVATVSTIYIPVLLGRAVDCLVYRAVDFAALFEIIYRMIKLIVITCISTYVMNLANNYISFNVAKNLRYRCEAKIEILTMRYVDASSHGDIVSRITTDCDTFCDGLLLGFNQFFTGVITIFGTIVFMYSVNGLMTLVVVALTPLSLVVARFIARRSFKFFSKQADGRGNVSTEVSDAIMLQQVVYSDESRTFLMDKFVEQNDILKRDSLKAYFYSSLVNPSTRFVNAIVYAAVALFGAMNAAKGSITVGALTSFLAYASQYTKPFNEISSVISELSNAVACAGRVYDFLDEDSVESDVLLSQRGTDTTDGVAVSFSDVFFSYDGKRQIIDGLTLEVNSGEHIALVGQTGCGKTTLINLIMRFYDVDRGSVKVNGTDVRDMDRETLRDMFGMVLQDTFLIDGTIADNISMGRDFSRERIIDVCKRGGAHNFIMRLPNGYDTHVTSNTQILSEGEKQLLCICRVMLKDASAIILDEATSSMDLVSEMALSDAMLKMMNNKTAFIIAHRLSTIKNADRIAFIKDGRVAEIGTHESLMELGGYYAQMYESQFFDAAG